MNWHGHLHEDVGGPPPSARADHQDLHSHFSEGIDALLDVAVFTTLGTALPWGEWHKPESPVTLTRLALYGVAVLLLRRLPAVFMLQKAVPEIRSPREACFVGWFGPMGVGALYYALKSGKQDTSYMTSLKFSREGRPRLIPQAAAVHHRLMGCLPQHARSW
jgi:hypothetical protein